MCILYLATFGSFIGFSAAFPMVIKQSFPEIDPLKVAFLGPLVGALFRPVGGWLSDKVGGACVTFWNYIIMTIAVIAVMFSLKMVILQAILLGLCCYLSPLGLVTAQRFV